MAQKHTVANLEALGKRKCLFKPSRRGKTSLPKQGQRTKSVVLMT